MSEALKKNLQAEIVAHRCIAILGAGVSIFSTDNAPCASWTGMLHQGVQRCSDFVAGLPADWASRANADIDSGDLDDLLCGAEKVSRKLSAPAGGEYGRWLRESVGQLQVSRPEVIKALQELGVILATTNYDSLIEQVTRLPPVTWRNGARVERVLRGDEPGVLHLHGHWQDPESVILGIRSYEQVVGSEHAQTMLRAMAAMRTMVFVGCGDGLKDPNFGALLAWTEGVFGGSEYRRFRLARSSEVAQLHKEHPGLSVVAYGAGFDDLAPFLDSLRSAAPALPSPVPPSGPISLPPRPRCFGRDEEIADLVAALLARQPEPLPVLGPPGIGKSNLALAAVHNASVAVRYGAHRRFVRCDGLHSRTDLAGAIAAALGLTLCADNESAALCELGRAPVLLVIDNTETAWESDTLGVEELLARLAGVPGVALLMTLRGNQRPAGVAWREPFRPQPLAPAAARGLFLSIAGQHFAADAHLDALLAAVDQVPLAITLLAHLAEGESDLEGLWARWQDERTEMLQRAGGKDRLTSIELSYELSWSSPRMTPAGRRLLQLLALLPAGIAHSDLPALLPVANQAAATLRKAGLAFDEAHRLRILAPLRESIRRRHPLDREDLERVVAHFVSLAEEVGQQMGRAQGGEAVIRLTAEAPNIEAMWLRGLDGESAAAVIAAAPAWTRFMRFSGVGSDVPLEEAAKVARKCGDLHGQANCVWSLGDIAVRRSNHDSARMHCDEALRLYRQIGDRRGEADCIRSMGDIALERSVLDAARANYEEALPLYQQVGDIRGEASCIVRLGHIALRGADHDSARALYEKALPMYRQAGDLLGEANCIKRFGDIALERKDHEHAREFYEKALPIYRQVGDLFGEANCIRSLGDVALRRRDQGGARIRYEQALSLYRRVGHLIGEGDCHFGMACAHLAQRSNSEAATNFRAALVCYQRVGAPCPIGATHFLLAAACDESERAAHRQAAREAWRGIDPKELAGMAASDGISAADLESLWQDHGLPEANSAATDQ